MKFIKFVVVDDIRYVSFINKKKVKCTAVQALRLCTGRTAHRGSRGIALLFHGRGTIRGWGVSVTPRPLFTPGKDPVPIVQEAGWAAGPVWTVAEILASAGIRSPDRPARSQSLYRLSYLAHNFNNNNNNNTNNTNNNSNIRPNAFLLLLVRFNVLPIHPTTYKTVRLSIRCKKTDQWVCLESWLRKSNTLAPNDQTTFIKRNTEHLSLEQVHIADENERFVCGLTHCIRPL